MKKTVSVNVSLEARLSILLAITVIVIILVFSGFVLLLDNLVLSGLFTAALVLPASLLVFHAAMTRINRILSALYYGFSNFLDNDFSVSLAKTRNDELGELIGMYNQVSEALRNERLYLYQRELLLDTVMQSTPLGLVLTEDSGTIIYSNSEARQLFNHGKAINGGNFNQLIEAMPKPFSRSISSGLNGLFTISEGVINETYHLTQNNFLLNGIQHHLYLFKRLTKEISRQEVITWKKVIRLISHELNNSLAPISSLSHSGQLLTERIEQYQLKEIFEAIEERATYLQSFIEGYAKFARLPKPQIQEIEFVQFLVNLKHIHQFTFVTEHQRLLAFGDPAQLQQVIINLLKNAHETDSKKQAIEVRLKQIKDITEIQVVDEGGGMSELNIKSALLPFYSTKQNGTGLGLPLCREIIDAHGGRILIANRKNKGLSVTVFLPQLPLSENYNH